jgi:hypothetical protein
MTKLSIDLGEEMTAFICADAAKRGITVEQYLSDLVSEAMKEALAHEESHRKLLEHLANPVGGTFAGGRPPKREELYDRPYRFR